MRNPTPEEILVLDNLHLKLEILKAELTLALYRLKESCGAPTHAQISEQHVWVDSQGNQIP